MLLLVKVFVLAYNEDALIAQKVAATLKDRRKIVILYNPYTKGLFDHKLANRSILW